MSSAGSTPTALEPRHAPDCPYAHALVQLRERRMRAAPEGNVTLLALKLRVNELLPDGVVRIPHLGGRMHDDAKAARDALLAAIPSVLGAPVCTRNDGDMRNVAHVPGWALVRAPIMLIIFM